jgi:cell division protein FtsB
MNFPKIMKSKNTLFVYTVISIILLVSCNQNKEKTKENNSNDEIKKRLTLLEQKVDFLFNQEAAEAVKKRAESEGFKVKEIKK